MSKTSGIIYLAFGSPYLVMALRSIRSLRKTNPDLPICLVTNLAIAKTDIPLLRDDDTLAVLEEDQANNRAIKTSINTISPYDRTLFLDCDTVVLGALDTGFRFLDDFDLAFRLNPYPQTRKGKADVTIMEGLTVGDCPHWNSGVMFFAKRPAADQFFQSWNENFHSLASPYDQVALVRTIFNDPARVLSLDTKWNASDPILGRKKWRARTKVFHYASNISNRLDQELQSEAKEITSAISGAVEETRRFVKKKRAQKQSEIGRLRYAAASLLWRVSSPT
ncbi:MAG: putative nucleotide-diphospho-sugar transferase [Hyphomicrobiales bacterium]